jgi:tetratricopeptide (TPR) repeat protein
VAAGEDRTWTLTPGREPDPLEPTRSAPLGPGAAIGRYRVLGRLGAGGMGVVYVAHDPELDRNVAIKLVHRDHAAGGQARLVREAKAMARLQHPNVIAVHDVGVVDGRVFVAMELVAGTTLRDWVGTGRPWRRVIAAFVAAARGLVAAHAAGLIHRDFKPENVLVGTDGSIRVADFGLARPVGPEGAGDPARPGAPTAASDPGLVQTETAAVVGTPAYMAPEQHAAGPVSAAADQYEFCVALWEALCGERPFTGATAFALGEAKRAMALAEPRGSAPGWLFAVLRRGLAAAPGARFASMEVMIAALERGLGRRRRVAIAAGALGLVAAGGIAVVVASTSPPACGDGASVWAGVWGPERASAVRTAFPGGPRERDLAERTAAGLDRYVVDWRAARLAACTAERAGEITTAAAAARRGCLDARVWGAGALVRILVDRPIASLVDDAPRLVAELAPIADCAAATAAPRPLDPAIGDRLAEATVLRRAGQSARALEVARAARERAREQDDARGIREATLVVGGALHDLGDLAAESELRAAADAGRDSGDWEIAAWALSMLVDDRVIRGDRNGMAALVAEASTASARVVEPGLRNALEISRAGALLRMGSPAEAGELCRKALADAEHIFGERSFRLASSVAQCAEVELARGDNQAALEMLARALAIHEAELGPDHPMVADSRHSLAIAHRRLGHTEEAIRLYRDALAIRERVFGPGSAAVADSLNSIAIVTYDSGDLAGAVAAAERSLVAAEAAFGATSRRAAAAHMLLASYAVEVESTRADARSHVERAFALFTASPSEPPDVELAYARAQWADIAIVLGDPAAAVESAKLAAETLVAAGDRGSAFVYMMWGRAERRRGRHAEAIAPLEKALVGYAPDQHGPGEVAGVEWELAQALWDSGRDPARAKRLATTARRRLLAAGDDENPIRAPLEAWLAKRK